MHSNVPLKFKPCRLYGLNYPVIAVDFLYRKNCETKITVYNNYSNCRDNVHCTVYVQCTVTLAINYPHLKKGLDKVT